MSNDGILSDFKNIDAFYAIIKVITPLINRIGFDYSGILESFEKLETKIGKFSVFHIPDFLPTDKKEKLETFYKKKYEYKRKTVLDFLKSSSKHSEFQKYSKNKELIIQIANFVSRFTSNFNDDELVFHYLEYYELIFNHFIEPIMDRKGSPVPKYKYRHFCHKQLDFVKKYLKKENLDTHLLYFVEFVNCKLRNALTHNNYYFDDEELYYYNFDKIKNKLSDFTLSRLKFTDLVNDIIVTQVVFILISGMRMAGITSEQYKGFLNNKVMKDS